MASKILVLMVCEKDEFFLNWGQKSCWAFEWLDIGGCNYSSFAIDAIIVDFQNT